MIIEWTVRIFNWAFRRMGGLNLIQICLLWLTLGCAGFGLAVVAVRLQSGLMLSIVFYCVLAGWLLARTRLPGWAYGLSGTVLGLLSLLLTTGHLGRTLAVLLTSLLPLAGQLLQRHMPDFSTTVAAWQALGEAEVTLFARFDNWFRAIGSNTPVIDPTVTSLLWGMALWVAVLWAVWWVRRRESTLVGLVPMAGLLGYNIYYTNSLTGTHWLVLTVGGMLALQAAGSYRSWQRRWIARRLDQVEIELVLAISVVLLTGGMMLAGNYLPSVSIQKISDAINRIIHPAPEQALAESLGLEQTPVYVPQPATSGNNINPAENHDIGPAPVLTQDIVLLVKVDGYTPPPPMSEYTIHMPIQNVIYYWRAQTYDSYSGHTWTAGTGRLQEMGAGEPFLQGVDLAALPAIYRLATQHVTRVQTGGKIAFAAGEILSLDQPSTVFWRDIDDIVSVSTDLDSYTVSSRIQSVNVETLRAAGTDYPPSLRRYLALPDELPQRVRDLALELTSDQPTPYDRAVLLETYLRQFPYSLAVPGPPYDRDAVDYFLFDLKRGYCDYFASAMVVMARTAGLPARLVIGYSNGTYNEEQGVFVVRAANAHAWAEIYFPGTGWVEFEPTPTLPRPIRAGQGLEGSQAVVPPMLGPADRLSVPIMSTWLRLLIRVLLAAAALVLVALALPLETWRLSLLPADQALRAIFQSLYRRGRSFGIPPNPSRTPHEFALELSASLECLANNSRQAAVNDCLRLDLKWLTGLYARLLFSEHPPNKEEKEKAIHTWRRLRQQMGKIRR